MSGRVEFQSQFPYNGLVSAMAKTPFFNLNKTMLISALVHASFFVGAILLSVKTVQPLPIGIEFNYDQTDKKPAKQAMAAPVLKPVVQKVEHVLPADPGAITSNEKAKPSQSAETTSTTTTATAVTTISGREGVANGQEVSPEDRYLYELKKLLERKKNYPTMAKKMGHTGTVTMRFTLKPDGTLTETQVLNKSQYDSLNEAAVTLVQSINKLKPFPSEIHKEAWVITVPIEYTLN
jgi:protein TonB